MKMLYLFGPLIFIVLSFQTCQKQIIIPERDVIALDFDGNGDGVIIPDNRNLRFTSSFTIEAWIYPRDVSTNPGGGSRIIMRKGSVNHKVNYVLQIDVYSGSGILSFGAGSGIRSKENTIQPYQWQHVAGVYNSERSLIKLYVNGKLVAKDKAKSKPVASEDPLSIGLSLKAYGSGTEDFFWGMMRDVRIWNIARTEKEIQENMHQQLFGVEPGLVANWLMDEGNGYLVHDMAKNFEGHLGKTSKSDNTYPDWVKVRFPNW